MKKLLLIVILVSGLLVVYAGEIDDFRFAVGLYRDQNYSLARSELQKFLNNYPESDYLDNVRFLLASVYLHEKDYDRAGTIFEQLYATATDPVIRPDIYLGLAQCYFFTNEISEAYDILARFVREFGQHRSAWKAYYFLGRIEYQKGNYQQSLDNLDKAERLSSDWQIRVARVETLLAIDNPEPVASMLNEEIREQTKNEYLYQMIVLYLNYLLEQQNYEGVLNYAYEYIPDSSSYYDDYLLILAEAEYELGNYSRALERLNMLRLESERSKYFVALSQMNLNNHEQAELLFTELSQEAASIEIRSNSYFFLASMKGRTDISEATRMLEQFVRENPQHPYIGAAHYQIGLNHFRQNSFNDAINEFDNALQLGISNEFRERALYLTAESRFQLRQRQQALQGFENYLEQYPQGRFVDETLFKIGLHYYEQDDYPNALVKFDRIVNEFPDSNRLSMTLFYQGEIFADSKQYDITLDKYQAALPGFEESNLLWLRIAQVNFLQGNYDRSLLDLNNVPDTEDFLFEKSIITGNIHFARGNYLQALRSFDTATRVSTTDEQWEDAILRQARTLYQLKEYREATNLYQRLYQRSPDEQYLLMAATAAFTAEDYRGAIQYYRQYIDTHPYGEQYYQAKLHIADSYYNLGDYKNAALGYQELLRPDIDRTILHNSLNGLEWSALQDKEIDFTGLLNEVIREDSPQNFILVLYDRKINFYHSQRKWNEVINTVRFVEQIAPDSPALYDYRRKMAISYTNLGQYRDAERVFQALHREKHDAAVLHAWAQLDLAEQDKQSALSRMQQAARLTAESRIWIDMLRLSVELNSEQFRRDYDQFMSFAKNSEREQAMLLLAEWNLQNENYSEALRTINILLDSSYEPIRAKAQYFKGVHLYETGNIREAIPELLRVRYLYPRIEDVRLEAEMLAIKGYIEINDRENAVKLFDAIKNSLEPEKREELKGIVEG